LSSHDNSTKWKERNNFLYYHQTLNSKVVHHPTKIWYKKRETDKVVERVRWNKPLEIEREREEEIKRERAKERKREWEWEWEREREWEWERERVKEREWERERECIDTIDQKMSMHLSVHAFDEYMQSF